MNGDFGAVGVWFPNPKTLKNKQDDHDPRGIDLFSGIL
jgi:hypothetical protein